MEVGGLLQDLFPLQEGRFALNHDYGRKGNQIAFTHPRNSPHRSHHQDDYIFSRESHPERLFATGQQV